MPKEALNIMRPFYIWGFLEGLIFWYAIEKLLWQDAGITVDQILLLGVIAQSSLVLIELPSSVLADRWSRKKSMLASTLLMGVCILLVVSSQTFVSFIIMALTWSLYYGLQSGTLNAFVFDKLKDQKLEKYYRQSMSRLTSIRIVALIISAALSSEIANLGDFLTPYWVTLIPTIAAFAVMWSIDEPDYKSEDPDGTSGLKHLKEALRAIKPKHVLYVLLSLAFIEAGRFVWYEYYQLYLIDLSIDARLFGLILAAVQIGEAIGAEIAHRVHKPGPILKLSRLLMIAGSVGLLFGQAWSVPFLVISFIGSSTFSIVMDENVQHLTPSKHRATTLSIAGLGSRLLFLFSAALLFLIDDIVIALAVGSIPMFILAQAYIFSGKKLHEV